MKQKQQVNITIQRGIELEAFVGTVIAESTTHYCVTHETNKQEGEWFPKHSKQVNCTPI